MTAVEIRKAKAYCAMCPVLKECFDFAMKHEEEYGVWGGTTHRERQRLRANPSYAYQPTVFN